ncbi:hypothetical protein D5086_003545 [Populus alba]|uniref:Uncharacterized protein n=1 Tax=Populus alba TaxID=43335 RepID=A0ACC4D697_POPAL
MVGWWGTVRFWRRREREKCMGLRLKEEEKMGNPSSPSGAGEKKKIPKGLGTVGAYPLLPGREKWLKSSPFCKAGNEKK